MKYHKMVNERRKPLQRALAQAPTEADYHAIFLAVGHRQFNELREAGIKALAQPDAVLYDVKSILPLGVADSRL